MRTPVALCLVVVVLLVGMTLPGVAIQDGPPDPSDAGDGPGDGPPDPANGGEGVADDDGGDGDDDGGDGVDDGGDGVDDADDDAVSVDEVIDGDRGPPDDDDDGGEGEGGEDDGGEGEGGEGEGGEDDGGEGEDESESRGDDDSGRSDSSEDDGDEDGDETDRDDDAGAGDDDAGAGDDDAGAGDDDAGAGNDDADHSDDGESRDESPGQGDERDDASGDADGRSSEDASSADDPETPSNPVTPLLPVFDGSDDDEEERDSGDESGGTETSHDSDDPMGVRDDEETSTPESESTPDGEAGGESAAGPDDGEPSVEIDTNDTATVVDVTDVEGGDTVEADLRGPATEGDGVVVESVTVRLEEGGPFTLTATRPTAEASDGAAPGVPVAYVDVATDADSVANATLTLAVDESALPDGVQPEDVDVLRKTDDGWETTETTYHEAEGVYTVETDGFSTFAVAAPSAGPLEVTDAEVSRGEGSGGEAKAVATVENTGDRRATETFAATVDGETVATREVTLEPGESATVTFDVPADRAEAGTVAVDGVEAGTLQVEETGAGTATAVSNANAAFGIGAAVFVLLSAVATGLLAARRDEWDREPLE